MKIEPQNKVPASAVVTLKELSRLLGESVERVRALNNRMGCPGNKPRESQTETIRIDSAAWLAAWRKLESATTSEPQVDEVRRWRAKTLELEYRKQAGELVTIDHVREIVGAIFAVTQRVLPLLCMPCSEVWEKAIEESRVAMHERFAQ